MHLIYDKKKFFCYVAPITFFYSVFMIIPIIVALGYSFTNYRGIGEYDFVGIRNYLRLFQDERFYRSLMNTLKVTVTTIIILLPLSFIYAILLQKETRFNQICRTLIFLPYTVGGIVVGLIWTFILDPGKGFINNMLNAVGLDFLSQQWIGGKYLTPYSVGIIGVWSATGFCMLLWHSGLKQISTDITEASIVDGASEFQQVWYVVLPMLKETFKLIFVLQFTGCLKVFESVQMLTGGGPNHFSETMVSYMYNTTFSQKLFGYGMSMASVEFLLTLIITLLFSYLTKKEIDE